MRLTPRFPARHLAALTLPLLLSCSARTADPNVARWQAQAERVTIVRDEWGVAHVHGPTDADAVFGMIYAQAEDDFHRIERNYLTALGRTAEADGEQAVWQDLRMRLFIDSTDLKRQFIESPPWLHALMTAWADGLNYYLQTHPDVKPEVLTHFEPWMPLAFSEGSIGGDIERISLDSLREFYGDTTHSAVKVGLAPTARRFDRAGSNGFAVAPANTTNHHALLLINPHTSFFFRSELQVTSDEGLNVYGAATWGQFFIYQGFNAHAGWMHTSSSADNQDEYAETVSKRDGGYVYRYGSAQRPVLTSSITIPVRTPSGTKSRSFTTYRTAHGPIVRESSGQWIAARLMQDPVNALTQSYSRTKARGFASFKETMQLHTNSSNNTIFADDSGHIALFYANFVPKRDPRFDWSKPVAGADTATEWHGVLSVDESPLVVDPASGWIQNTNNWPFSAAGVNTLRADGFPTYLDVAYEENQRGVHAMRVLSARRDFTLETLRDAAFDSYQPAFAELVPTLLAAYDALPPSDARKAKLAEPIRALRGWDYRWSATSVPTTLAVYWGEALWRRVLGASQSEDLAAYAALREKSSASDKLDALVAATDSLTVAFGQWKTPWGDVNRFQRLTNDITHRFDDAQPSLAVPFTTGQWGSLASFSAVNYPKTKKRYGVAGNSFVAVVEFGDSVRAKAVTAGGESGRVGSTHFSDQAARYAAGNLRDVYFYPNQLVGHTERTYHPGK